MSKEDRQGMDEEEIINKFVEKAKEVKKIEYWSTDDTKKVAEDFIWKLDSQGTPEKITDQELAQLLKDHGLERPAGGITPELKSDFVNHGIDYAFEGLKRRIIDNATYDSDDHYTNDPDWDGYMRYESRKYSSFKNQQTITENFRRFLKK